MANTVGAVLAAGELHKPNGLIDLLSQIERIASVENGGAELPKGYVTMKLRIDYFTVAFKVSFFSSLFMGLMMPIAISVVLDKLPIFGSINQSLFDKAYIMIFAVSLSLAYAYLIGTTLMRCGSPNATKDLIKQFIGGYNFGLILKSIILFIGYHACYFIFPEERIFNLFSKLVNYVGDNDFIFGVINSMYQFTAVIHSVLVESAYVAVITSILSSLIIYLYRYIGLKQQTKSNKYDY